MIREFSNRHPVVFNDVCDGVGDVYEETLGEWFAKRQVNTMFALEQATKAQRGSRGIDLLFL
jgi:hypothetical protein